MVSLSGTFQYTYYPKTFDWSAGDDYVAIAGDSYSEGAGDSFLNDDPDYSIGHFLHRGGGRNFLIFGRSGYGSVSAARGVVENIRFSHLSPYFRDLDAPEEILFFFYEGNDLNNNLEFLAYFDVQPGETFDADLDRVLRDYQLDGYADWKIALRAFVPTIDLLSNLYRNTLALLGLRGSEGEAEEDDRRTILKGPTGEFALPPLQTAAVELGDAERNRAIRVFEASIGYLKETFPKTPIRVVYLPSIVGVYDWQGDISIQKYTDSDKRWTTAEENDRISRAIRDRFAALAEDQGFELIDMTATLRGAAKTALLHGPNDWHHLNRRGYELVAEELLRRPTPAPASR
ncbi:MAG: hypothetical protein AAGC99_15295 [Pseudomonadota bacterium]